MGLYDTFGERGIQLKVGPCEMLSFNVGDDVPVYDGVYVAHEGAVVVKDGKLLATYDKLFTARTPMDSDGVYIERDGVLVKHGKTLLEFSELTTKWGGSIALEEVSFDGETTIEPERLLDPHNYVKQAIEEVVREHEKS